MVVKIERVETKKDWKRFIDIPWDIYQGDPKWVPPLKIAVSEILDINKNPFFKHAFLYPLVATKNGRAVGRMVGVIDENHNRYHNETTAFFGFFESIDDEEVTRALFEGVKKWGKERGMTDLRGPYNPNINAEAGLLVEGFDDSPYVMMTYNPEYYGKLIESQGFKKAKDMYAYELDVQGVNIDKRLLTVVERQKRRGSIKLRPINTSKFDQEVQAIFKIFNESWSDNWGFVPFTDDEFKAMVKELKMIYDPRIILIAEIKGEIAGFGIAIPDVNIAIKQVRDGKLFPTGLFKLLWYLKGPGRKKVNRLRIPLMGVKKKFEHLGVGGILYLEYIEMGPRLGYERGEFSWILEDNKPMNEAIKKLGAMVKRRYRIYEERI